MTTHDSAQSDRAARPAGTDSSLSTSRRDILTAALQELIEAELTALIGAAPGERTPSGPRCVMGIARSSCRPRAAMLRSPSRSCVRARSSPGAARAAQRLGASR
jgi:hypothetical protein